MVLVKTSIDYIYKPSTLSVIKKTQQKKEQTRERVPPSVPAIKDNALMAEYKLKAYGQIYPLTRIRLETCTLLWEMLISFIQFYPGIH